jgi:hypothetical protein
MRERALRELASFGDGHKQGMVMMWGLLLWSEGGGEKEKEKEKEGETNWRR